MLDRGNGAIQVNSVRAPVSIGCAILVCAGAMACADLGAAISEAMRSRGSDVVRRDALAHAVRPRVERTGPTNTVLGATMTDDDHLP